jgi:ADP-ribosyl-[dinitrogen reductase] hydrolase
MTTFNADRVTGVLLGQAASDALGAGYEFTTPPPGARIYMKGGGAFDWEPGEWTDDTQMAICVAESAAGGHLDPMQVGQGFLDWYRSGPKDVGGQTGWVLGRAKGPEDLPGLAEEYCRTHPKCAGNGSLMRTGPVALAYLGEPDRIAAAAREISGLTHADPLCGDACVLWCLAIDRAVHDAVFDLTAGLGWLPAQRRDEWAGYAAEAEDQPPTRFTGNGYVVVALQAAWSAITHTAEPEGEPCRHLQDTLAAAVRIGHDTDTVAAIAGALLGARWGSSAVPLEWKRLLHGWPNWDGQPSGARDLARLAVLAARKGQSDSSGWPSAPDLLHHYRANNPARPMAVPLPSDAGLTLGNVHAAPTTDADVIVSLCRMGSQPLRPEGRHLDVLLIDDDGPDANPNLDFILGDTADAIATWRQEGEMVFVHCVQAQSRTPTIGAAYLIRQFGVEAEVALAEVEGVLGGQPWNQAFVRALGRIPPVMPASAPG